MARQAHEGSQGRPPSVTPKRPRNTFLPAEEGDHIPLLWFRFVATNYRLLRASLLNRRLIPPGQPLREDRDAIKRAASVSIDPTSVLAPFGDPLEPVATAIFLGIQPEDPVLHWFGFHEFAPSEESLLDFESELIAYAGKALLRGGKLAAHARMERIFGRCHHAETRDWVNLPVAYAREFSSMNEEDDRTIMLARLESVRKRCEAALDLRGEMAALRTMSQVAGLLIKQDGKEEREMERALSVAPPRSLELANPRNKPKLVELALNPRTKQA